MPVEKKGKKGSSPSVYKFFKVDGDKVTMTCKKADKLSVGDKVKISPPKKKGAVEGC